MTFGRYWSPSGLRVLGVPFIWVRLGPPRHLLDLSYPNCLCVFGCWNSYAIAPEICREKSTSLRDTARAATIGIGVTRESCAALQALGVRRVEQMPQMALTEEDLAMFGALPHPPPGPLRAICIGRHVHWKGFYLAIRAFALFAKKRPDAQLWIINDGPFRKELEKTVARTGMSAQVKFLGVLPTYQDVLHKLGQTHVLMHPALHEGFGNVCLEAMAAGGRWRAWILVDRRHRSLLKRATRLQQPIPQEAVIALAAFLEKIDGDRSLLATMSARAREHVQKNFTMRQINETMRRYYREAVETHGTR